MRDQAVEALLAGVEHVGARARGDARRCSPAGGGGRTRRADRRHQALALVARRDVAHEVAHLAAQRAQLRERLATCAFLAHAAEREVEPFRRERARDAEPDAARAARDEGYAPHAALPGP